MANKTKYENTKIWSWVVFFLVPLCMFEPCEGNAEANRVTNLPGQPQIVPPLSQFSGYITVNERHGRALFYWFFEAQTQPSQKPLLLWLNGGPGCSSIGNGAVLEVGPLIIVGGNLEFNPHSWYKEANLLFVESPVGVGFSYTNTSCDFNNINDQFVAEDTYTFLVEWLQIFPQFKNCDFYIAGESYAGHYVPQLAELVYERNNNLTTKYPHINLKGFIVGNPETSDYFDYKAQVEFAWAHSIISDQTYYTARDSCDFTSTTYTWSTECHEALDIMYAQLDNIDKENIYGPTCLRNASSSFLNDIPPLHNNLSNTKGNARGRLFGKTRRVPGGDDPCYERYLYPYFNRKDVQRALHIRPRNGTNVVEWKVCNSSMFSSYNYNVFSVLPTYEKVTKLGLKIWIYSGDVDWRVPTIGSRYCVENLNLTLKTPWQDWFSNHQVAGRMMEYEGLTFITVRGAGHMVPYFKPNESLAMIHSYLTGEPLQTHR